MGGYLRGTCEDFCPEQERKLRIKERLLNFYEFKNHDERTPGIIVKEFARSAAGNKTPKPKDLRSEACLDRVVKYLLTEIILDDRKSYRHAYDFVFNRLRSVRQEIVMQNLDCQSNIKLLQPVIMFLVYSRYRLCEESIDDFDPKICDQHLQECLKRVLVCYDEMDLENAEQSFTQQNKTNRIYIEGLYQLFNLGAIEAIERAIRLPQKIRNNKTFQNIYDIALEFHRHNFYKVLHGISTLPHILSAMAAIKVQSIRMRLFGIFAHAYNNKQLTVPVEFIRHIMLYRDVNDLLSDCKYYNIRISKDSKSIQFLRVEFNSNVGERKPKLEHFVEEKLEKCFLPSILLLKKL